MNDSSAEHVLQSVKKITRALKLKTKITRVVLPTRETCYFLVISTGNISLGVDIGQVDFVVFDKTYKDCLFEFLSKYLKPTSKIVCINDSEDSCDKEDKNKDKIAEIVVANNETESLAHLIKIISDIFAVKRSTMLRILKTLKRDDINSLIEAYITVTKR